MRELAPGQAVYEAAYDEQVDGQIGLPAVIWRRLSDGDHEAWARIEAVASPPQFTTSELVLLLDAVMVHHHHVAAIPENDASNLPPLEALQRKIERLLATAGGV